MSSTVSVVIPSFNGARSIESALDRVAAQTHSDIECIVVDDGSTDETVELARSHWTGPTVISPGHFGVAVARNRALAVARSDWVGFLDQDDLWRKN